MKNQTQKILEQMEQENPKQLWFSLNDINKWLAAQTNQVIWDLAPTADYPIFMPNYVASIFHNCSIRPKVPKIQRKKIKGHYHYQTIKL